jgi:PIN domain nuclease of toxin-antitoxin system
MGMSKVVVLDTHIWFWFVNQEFDRFPNHWLEIIETTEQVGVSVISCYEIALAQQRARIDLPCKANQWFQDALEPTGIALFPLSPEIVCHAVELSPIHKDPFDRLIIATTLEYDAKLASVDSLFPQYPELYTHLIK